MAILDQERNINLYSAEAYSNNTVNWEDGAAIYRAKALLHALKNSGILERVNSILDVGCGSGGVLANFRQLYVNPSTNGRKINLRGIDISDKAIQIAKCLHLKDGMVGLDFENKSITDLGSNDKYSLITLIHVLEHCPDMLEMLKACEKNAEYIYINVPIEVNLFYSIRPGLLKNQYLIYGHIHFFNKGFFVTWLKKNGYKVIFEVYSADFEVSKPGILYNLMKLTRRLFGYFSPNATAWLLGGYSLGVLIQHKNSSC